jgi:hypothetical protein
MDTQIEEVRRMTNLALVTAYNKSDCVPFLKAVLDEINYRIHTGEFKTDPGVYDWSNR